MLSILRHPTLFNYIIDWILRQALQDYPGVQVGANVHVSDLAYADDIVILSSSYSEMQSLFEVVNRHAALVGMRINASKTKVMSALIPDDQRKAVLLNGEPLEDVGKSKYLGSMFVQTARAPSRKEGGLILFVPHSLAYNLVFGCGVKYRCAKRAGRNGLPGRSAIHSTLRLRDMACASSRRKDVGSL